MNRLVRGSLLLLLAATIGLPAVTAHTLWQHLSGLSDGVRVTALLHRESLVLLGLSGVAATPLIRLGIAGARALRASHRFARVAAAGDERWQQGIAYVRIPDPHVSLFAAGFFRPRIYVTQGAEDILTPALLQAGLLHELAHLRGHHPRWLVILAALRYAYRPLPGAAPYFDAVRLETERQADGWALRAGTYRADLFDAIALAAAADLTRGAHRAVTALGGVGVEQRLRWIALDEPTPHRIPVIPAALWAAALWAVPLAAHVLLWAGVISGVSWHHTM